jgi:hypothetical protein
MINFKHDPLFKPLNNIELFFMSMFESAPEVKSDRCDNLLVKAVDSVNGELLHDPHHTFCNLVEEVSECLVRSALRLISSLYDMDSYIDYSFLELTTLNNILVQDFSIASLLQLMPFIH